ncbi:MAG: heavy-metal-associated domain-containing protein [Nitrospirae bacterium]|nr:heavy-metal-associated domain-containing protein [Nitrospirota bacterium]MBF0540015.1 heavy-metal-associated domain-containing protein [Nitrospirota bacterium]
MAEVRVKIDGMSCQHCVNNVKKAIDALAGIVSSDVTKGLAVIQIDEKAVSKAKIENAIIDAGYKIIG